MKSSQYLKNALQLLKEAKGCHYSSEQRKGMAINLASLILNEAKLYLSYSEKKQQKDLAKMMNDPAGKIFFTALTDQCFRSNKSSRAADQLVYLIKKYGIPKFLSPLNKIQMFLFYYLGKQLSGLFIPLVKRMLRKKMSKVILPAEEKHFAKHLKKRRRDGVRINLNHLGEAILGEGEAENRLNTYLKDLANPQIECISVKISTLFSQLSLLGTEQTLKVLENRLKTLYRSAKENKFLSHEGSISKFVNLDMEEYRDLHLTVALFKRVLDDAEFYQYSAGIVLQAYLPDAFLFQQELTVWAMQRVANGGAPIRIRLVKGANLAMEHLESTLKGWPQAPYLTKLETDANYKKMLTYACEPERIKAVHIGVGSHNLFDIAYALLLRSEKNCEKQVTFEMLEGMAGHIQRAIQSLGCSMLLYCPVVAKHEFQNGIAYLMRRLDENTAQENFLRHAFEMLPGSAAWKNQVDLFSLSCRDVNDVSQVPRRQLSRFHPPLQHSYDTPFENEPDTDWALPQNVKWTETILRKWVNKEIEIIPLVIGEKTIVSNLSTEKRNDPSNPGKELYRYTLAGEAELEIALKTANQAMESWNQKPLNERLHLIDQAAYQLRLHRDDLIGAMVADTAKTVSEADTEVSEAIDFAAYSSRIANDLHLLKDIVWLPKGPVLVAPPWNFPCSIPAGGILAALAAGNTVLFKPAPEAVLVGWQLVNALWEAGIGKDVLQFICCHDDPIGTRLIQDPRLAAVILTGATTTARKFLKLRPGIDLIAETGGKNSLIITGMADRDLAIKDLLQSAFGYSGQKCSACSLAILEKEVYDDPHFIKQLRDAAVSLKVGSPWDLSTKIVPLIRQPGDELLRALTSLEEGEEWLLEPKQNPENSHLWSPGIKLGVRPGSFTHQTELFGPVLGLMRAENLAQAIEWANATPYGLTAGIHSLDEREQQFWKEGIIAGNCYVNRTITGAIVQRQPFGGCKASQFGQGAKAGGPNYLIQLMRPQASGLPEEREPIPDAVVKLNQLFLQGSYKGEELESWKAAIGSYAFYLNHHFSKSHDPSHLVGQHNFFSYKPRHDLVLRMQKEDSLSDLFKCMAACLTCSAHLEISAAPGDAKRLQKAVDFTAFPLLTLTQETETHLIDRIQAGLLNKIRFLSKPSHELKQVISEAACDFAVSPVQSNGRIELLHYLREVSLSIDYHRYGYIP